MSALTEKIAAEHHVYGVSGFGPEQVACSCDLAWVTNAQHARHVAEVTEAAVRQQISHEIKTAVLPTHPNRGYRDGFAYAARIARGES